MNETAETMSSSASTTAVNKHYGCSEVETSHIEYEWIIKDFRLFLQENGECIYSPIFSAKENDKVKWKLQLYPHGEKIGDTDYVSLFLFLHSRDPKQPKLKIHGELSIFKSEDIKCKRSITYTYETEIGYGFAKMMERSKLLDSGGSDDSIILSCKVDIPQRIITKPVDPVAFDLPKSQMNEHFSRLLGDLRFSDVTILVGNEKFTAHKVVLAARSTVFAAMFEHKEMEENQKNEVKIEDLEPAAVKGMLEFIYTDKVTDLEALAGELLRASDKYELDNLKIMCEEVLYRTLSNDNAAEILVLSDLYGSSKLKGYVMKFIDRNLPSVVQSESFKSMVGMHSELVGELMCSVATWRESKA